MSWSLPCTPSNMSSAARAGIGAATGGRRPTIAQAAAAGQNMTSPGRQCTALLSLRDLPLHYTGVLLDQFGVLHDGLVPYPGGLQGIFSRE